MDSNASGFLLNNSILHSVYCQNNEENGMIDLGLSLRTFQPQPYHPSTHLLSLEAGYGGLISWPSQASSSHRESSNAGYSELAPKDPDDEAEGVQSKGVSGLRLFELESEFLLFYKDDTEDNWKNVGDVPWKEFAERVKRLRIGRKNDAVHRHSTNSS
ncbi:hypothetical protein F3Y22_tig00110840pilonHSYRG00096 [Hibiscus syriacus]|uniref:Auxin-responsive protein n=1 Tax=Hibiscus syriacus TaxID=106335 RepID=A0A6A2ZKT0_HIBSY|nr:hypothetical protein F3Y22_tig00110840pilonHSYRG00096 [Hibiscus syriacus]